MSVTVRGRQAVLLLRPLIRAVPWGPPAAAALMSSLAVLPALLDDPAPGVALWGLRAAAILFGAAAAFAMVDQMAPVTVTPTPRWLRQWLRLTVMVVPATVGWLMLYAIVRRAVGAAAVGPAAGVIVEAAVCGLTGLAGAAVTARYRHTSTVAMAGPGAQATLVAASLFLTGTYSPWPLPGATNWHPVHRYWLASLPIIVAVLILANRDTWPLPIRQGMRRT